MLNLFNKKSPSEVTLPDHSRVWIYQSNRELSDSETSELRTAGKEFVQNWTSHGSDLLAAFDVIYNRFLVIYLDEKNAAASGCSIDSSVGFIRQTQEKYQIDLLDRLQIAFKDGEEVKTLPMAQFQAEMKSGNIDENTVVFNNLVKDKAEFDAKWEVAIKDSWHRQWL